MQTLDIGRPRVGVAVLLLNRPERLNAINEAMQADLLKALGELADDRSVHAVVLTGAGRGFCAGIDMRDFGPDVPEATAPALDRIRFQEKMAALTEAVRALPQPVIAAVNGPCVGAGFALCLASDIRICSQTASFGNAAILLGLSGAEMGMSYHLPRVVGTSVAADWMLTGRTVSAAEADRRGLVSEVVDPDRADRPRRGVSVVDRRTCTAGRAVDQAGPAGQHRRGEPRVGAGTGEPQPGDLARDRRSGPTPPEVVFLTRRSGTATERGR